MKRNLIHLGVVITLIISCLSPATVYAMTGDNQFNKELNESVNAVNTVKEYKEYVKENTVIELKDSKLETMQKHESEYKEYKIEQARKAEEARKRAEEEKRRIEEERAKQARIQEQITNQHGFNANRGSSNSSQYKMTDSVKRYTSLFKKYGAKFKVDYKIMMAMCQQESQGNPNQGYPNQPAWGLMQIENTLAKEFASFGNKYFGQYFSLEDRLNPEYSIAFACYRFSKDLKHYNGDYTKTIQAYNFSKYSLDLLIQQYPDTWLSHRHEIGDYNGHGAGYGDRHYVEHVMRYYNK